MTPEKNVLVVDDETMIRESVSAYITRATMFLPPRMAKRRHHGRHHLIPDSGGHPVCGSTEIHCRRNRLCGCERISL